MDVMKLFAWFGVAFRRSRPSMILARVTLVKGMSPDNFTTSR